MFIPFLWFVVIVIILVSIGLCYNINKQIPKCYDCNVALSDGEDVFCDSCLQEMVVKNGGVDGE